MSTHFRIGVLVILFGIPCLGCGSKEAEGVPQGENIPAAPDRNNGAKATFKLSVPSGVIKLAQGGKAKVVVTAERLGYEGPIVIELSNMPAKVSASSKATLAAGAKEVEIEIVAAQDAEVGDKAGVTALAAFNPPVASGPFTIKVEKAAEVSIKQPENQFALQVDPDLVRVTAGGKIKVRVSADRKGYDGAIIVELVNMPGLVSGGKGTIAAGEKDVVLELTADPKAAAGETKGVIALGNGDNSKKGVSPPFTIAIAEAAALFELRLKNDVVEVKQGDKAKFEITIDRKSYEGPVIVELSNLPEKVTMGKVIIAAGQLRKALEIVADPAAPQGKKTGVTVLATTAVGDTKTILSKPFAVVVTKGTGTSSNASAPFDLKVEPAEVTLKAGMKIKLRVTVDRQNSFQGQVLVELKNLHPLVKSGKLMLKEGQKFGDLELWALPNAPTGQLTQVTVVGTFGQGKDQQVTSASTLTVNVFGTPVVVVPVGPAIDAVWFDLKLTPQTLNIRPGTFAVVRVSVSRKNGFAGAVAVQLKGLPNSIQARTGTIGKNQSHVDLQISANPRAPVGTSASVTASGMGSFAGRQQQQTSPAITINVKK
jgi:hypothetical protein